MNRKTQITIETRSITIIRTKGAFFSTHCGQCRKTVTGFTTAQLATVLQKDIAEISNLLKNSELHLTGDGHTALICGGQREDGGSQISKTV
jgi:hypothetical protein